MAFSNWIRRARGRWSGRPPCERLFLFIHLPKCAGTSLLKMLAHLGPGRSLTVAESTSKSAAWEHVRAGARRVPAGELDLIMGRDVLYGMHRVSAKPPWYFTFLRDPVSRYVSQYNFYVDAAGDPQHPAHRVGRDRVVVEGELLSLAEFARLGRDRNMMVRALADAADAPRQHEQWWWKDEREAADQALAFAERLDFIGLVEEFETDCDLVFRQLGICPPRRRVNVSRHRQPVDDDLLEAIKANNQLDLHLYRTALKLRRRNAERLADSIPH